MRKKYDAPLIEIVLLNAGEVMQGFNIGISGEAPPEESDAKQSNDFENDSWQISNNRNLWDD